MLAKRVSRKRLEASCTEASGYPRNGSVLVRGRLEVRRFRQQHAVSSMRELLQDAHADRIGNETHAAVAESEINAACVVTYESADHERRVAGRSRRLNRRFGRRSGRSLLLVCFRRTVGGALTGVLVGI